MASLNPITCKTCDARFSVPDELFKRRLSGRKVIVRCRNCGAHITVDATDSAPPPEADLSTGPDSAPTPPESAPPESPRVASTPAAEPSTKQPVRPVRTPAVARGVVPRLAGQKSKLPPVVPRAFTAPQSVRSSLRASAGKSGPESSEASSAVVVTAAKPASLSHTVGKNLPPRPAPATAAALRPREVSAPELEPTSSSSTRLVAVVPRATAPAPKVDKSVQKSGEQPAVLVEDVDRLTVPRFDLDEAPTRPLGTDLPSPPPAAPQSDVPSSGTALVGSGASLGNDGNTATDETPSSARDGVEPEEAGAGVLDNDAPEPPAVRAESESAPLGNGMVPGGEVNAPADAQPQPGQVVRPATHRRGTRWVIAILALVAAAAAAAVFLRSSPSHTPKAASAAHDSHVSESASRSASSDSPRSQQATPVPSAAQDPASVAPFAAASAEPHKDSLVNAPGSEEQPGRAAPEANASETPVGMNRDLVIQRVTAVLARAERCHLGGRATGTATVVLTFESNGHVSDARIEGEPIATAPVAACILTHARSLLIPKFSGPSFTLRQPITLR